MLEEHMKSRHRNEHEQQRDIDTVKIIEQDIKAEVSECSICDDKFLTEDDYTKHVKEHLKEIKEIYIEYLKSGHEIFDCNTCHFKSNIPEVIKNHLAEHVIQPKDKAKVRSKTREYKKAMYKSKNWQDMYDNIGNPIFDSTDNDASSESEE